MVFDARVMKFYATVTIVRPRSRRQLNAEAIGLGRSDSSHRVVSKDEEHIPDPKPKREKWTRTAETFLSTCVAPPIIHVVIYEGARDS